MIDALPTTSDRSELLNGKNPKADARLMAAVASAGSKPPRLQPGKRGIAPQGSALNPGTRRKGVGRTGRAMTRGVRAR